MRASVDFPDPDSPTIPSRAEESRNRSIPATALWPPPRREPKVFSTPTASSETSTATSAPLRGDTVGRHRLLVCRPAVGKQPTRGRARIRERHERRGGRAPGVRGSAARAEGATALGGRVGPHRSASGSSGVRFRVALSQGRHAAEEPLRIRMVCGHPQRRGRPGLDNAAPYMTTIRSANCRQSSMSWLTMTSPVPSSLVRETRSCITSREREASRALVGSSAITSLGCPQSASAIMARCRIPPDNSYGRELSIRSVSVSPTLCSHDVAAASTSRRFSLLVARSTDRSC